MLKYEPDHLIWEDTIEGIFSAANPYLLSEIVAPLQLPRVIDISHTFISWRGDNNKLIQTLEDSKPYTKYFHLVDSMGQTHDSLPLGKGLVDWERVKPYTIGKDFIFEIGLESYYNSKPMEDSVTYYNNVKKS